MFAAGMSPASTSERYASDSAMPSEIQRGPSMQALPPSSYCQRWMYSWAASSFRSVLGVHVSGAAAGGDDQARLDVTISNDGPMVRQQKRSVPSPTRTFTVTAFRRSPPALAARYAPACAVPSCTSAMSLAPTPSPIAYVTPVGEGGVGRGAEPSAFSTVTTQKTPWSSIQVAPSTSGRMPRRYVPASDGACTLNWNHAICPGPTYAAGCTLARLKRGQPVAGEPSAPSPPRTLGSSCPAPDVP